LTQHCFPVQRRLEDTVLGDEGIDERHRRPVERGLVHEDGEVASGIAVTRNEAAIERDGGLDTPLADGDELRVAHSLRGG